MLGALPFAAEKRKHDPLGPPRRVVHIQFPLERWDGPVGPWAEHLGKGKKQVKYSYMPFGAGKRSCPGGAMSQIENTLALSMLLRRFRPEYVGQVPAGIAATVTLVPKGGLMFKMHELS